MVKVFKRGSYGTASGLINRQVFIINHQRRRYDCELTPLLVAPLRDPDLLPALVDPED
jgi:hypothetical protein